MENIKKYTFFPNEPCFKVGDTIAMFGLEDVPLTIIGIVDKHYICKSNCGQVENIDFIVQGSFKKL